MSELPIRFLDVAKMSAEPPPPVAWLAAPLLPRGCLVALYAPGGDGKSLLALGLATAMAHGAELAGIDCAKGDTVYLDAENGVGEIHRRVHTLGVPSSGVRIADAGGLDLRANLDLIEALAEEGPDLIVLDSFRSMTPGLDENDTKQTSAAIDPLRRLAHTTGTTILLVHHANKAGRDFRGASSIRDSVDVLWHLGRQEDDDDRFRRFLRCSKMRVAAEPERMWLRLVIDRGRVLIDEAEPAEQTVSTKQIIRRELSDEILAAMNGQTLRLTAIAELVGRKPSDGSVRNALGALVGEGLLERQGSSYCKLQTGSLQFANKAEEELQIAKPLRGLATLQKPGNALTADCIDEDDERWRTQGPAPPAEAEPAERCSCEHPLPDEDDDGRLCAHCGRWMQ
jgi:hypothetical protein